MLEFRLNENTTQGKLFVEFIKTLPFIEIINKERSKTKISKDEFIVELKTSIQQANEMNSGKIKKKNFSRYD